MITSGADQQHARHSTGVRRVARPAWSRWECAAVALCALGLLLRLWRLDAQALWWDEAISVHLTRLSVGELLAERAAHVHPPLYFLLLKGWVALAGMSRFSARYLSLWFNTLLVALAYAVGRRLLNRQAGLAAAFISATSALYVVYSQEARVYAILPLLYLLMLGLLTRMTRLLRSAQPADLRRDWVSLALVQTAGLYMHYTFVIPCAYTNLVLLGTMWRRRQLRTLLPGWLLSVGLVGLLCAPWLGLVFANRAAVRADAGTDDPFVETLPVGYFLRLVWGFQWSGLTAAVGYPALNAAAVGMGCLLLAGLMLIIGCAQARGPALRLLAHWMLPIMPAVLLWWAKPLSHPRYLLVFSIALFMLVAYALVEVGRRGRLGALLAGALALAVCANSALALHAWFCDPRFAKDDVHALARWLEETAQPGDVIVAPWEDWTLDFAYHGVAPIVRPNPLDERACWEELAAAVPAQEGARAFLVTYPRGTKDRRELLPFALEAAGSLTGRRSFKGLLVRTYTLERAVAPPPAPVPLSGGPACFGPLCLGAVWLQQGAPADTAVAVALDWRLQAATAQRLGVSLRLRDPTGWERASVDTWLLDAAGLPSERWAAGKGATTYHVLPLAAGTPPVTCTLSLEVYAAGEAGEVRPFDLLDAAGNPAGRALGVGTVALRPALGLVGDPYRVGGAVSALAQPVELAPGLLLEGAALSAERAGPGQALSVRVQWRATRAPLADLRPALTLVQSGTLLARAAEAPVGGAYPTTRWHNGEVVAERRTLLIPAQAAAGPAELLLELNGRSVRLGGLAIEPSTRAFKVPSSARPLEARFGNVAALVGYDLAAPPYPAGQPITLTLYWRALEGAAEADYVVFTHLLAADGRLVGQHDGLPAGGSRPTRGWLPGEVVTDMHVLEFREHYAGQARLEVGLYEAGSLERVPLEHGGDALVLPGPLWVE
jgi:mannosyltransferase